MKRLLPFLLLLSTLVLAVAGVSTAGAQGVILPPPCPVDGPCPGGVRTDPEGLKIDFHRVDVDIENQIANTNVDMQFTNESRFLAEGTFLFPLPIGAAVDQLTMWVDGVPIEARILPADEARNIYNEIVRRFRDPALLEYVGTSAIQANVFPIPPGDSRRIQIAYSHILEVDNGLLHYVYPISTRSVTPRAVEDLSITVSVDSNEPVSNIYSPSHNIAVSRRGDNEFNVGFEAVNSFPENDFSLYYGIDSETINVNMLSFRESANEDGFFMLLVQPPIEAPEGDVIPHDVVVVLDQSGSMFGEKWDQARGAAEFVLENLNAEDRFNLITFSTGFRTFSNKMENPATAEEAIDWIRGLEAIGGTDINAAMLAALEMADAERATTVLFLTDGVATEGTVETQAILDNISEAGRPNVRVFTFGVGDDVDTFLLDAIVRDQRGTGSYVRTGERIDEEVASLYNKISAPVLTDVELDFGDLRVEDLYPTDLADLFAGNQLTLVGRYRGDADDVTVTLRGLVGAEERAFIYDGFDLPARAGGEPFIARLWATRRIGDLLNTIRLNGENPELVDSVVRLSTRYGIITPFTSFLIEEDDILTQRGRDEARRGFETQAQSLAGAGVGGGAVDASEAAADLADANAPALAQAPLPTQSGESGFFGNEEGESDGDGSFFRADGSRGNVLHSVNDKTFILQDGVWIDTSFEPDTMTTEKVVFLDDDYFALLEEHPELSDYFALGDQVIVVLDGTAYEVVAEA